MNKFCFLNVSNRFLHFCQLFQHKHSDSTRVMLRQITIKSTGHYRCEISAEAPNFASIQGEGHMEVVCKYIVTYFICAKVLRHIDRKIL